MKVGLFAEAGEERGVVWTRVIGGPLKLGTLLVVDEWIEENLAEWV